MSEEFKKFEDLEFHPYASKNIEIRGAKLFFPNHLGIKVVHFKTSITAYGPYKDFSSHKEEWMTKIITPSMDHGNAVADEILFEPATTSHETESGVTDRMKFVQELEYFPEKKELEEKI